MTNNWKYKAVVLDLDGTLVHTTQEYRTKLLREVFQRCGIRVRDDTIEGFWFGADRDATIRETGIDTETFWATIHELDTVERRTPHLRVYDDVIPALRELRELAKLGIFSGAPARIARIHLELLGRKNFTSVVLSDGAEVPYKPNPQGLLHCLKELEVEPDNGIYGGNATEDVLVARNAQVLDVIVDRDECQVEPKPTHRITSLGELAGIVKNYKG